MNTYVRYGSYIVDPQESSEVARKLKGPLTLDVEGVKSAENLGGSPSKRDLLIDTSLSPVNLAGQSLQCD